MNLHLNGGRIKVLPVVIDREVRLPGYLIGRRYVDFSDPDFFEDGIQLIMNTIDRE